MYQVLYEYAEQKHKLGQEHWNVVDTIDE
ncbi:unnamed protein product, partial [Vitis vinifera]